MSECWSQNGLIDLLTSVLEQKIECYFTNYVKFRVSKLQIHFLKNITMFFIT